MLTINDVLRPQIINIGGRRYRHLPQKDLKVGASHHTESEQRREAYVEEDSYYYDEPESCLNEYDEVESNDSGGFSITMKDIPAYYFKFFIGIGGKKLAAIERDTRTKLKIPPKGCDGDVVISGKKKCDVIAAQTKLQSIIELQKKDQPPTHFLCIPLDNPQLKPVFEQFQRNVLDLQARGVEASIFQAAERLHLTLCLTSFLNDAELFKVLPKIEKAVRQWHNKYFYEVDVKIVLEGIEYMNDDPGEVDVLYAKVRLLDNSERLQNFVDEFLEHLAQEGFIKRQHDSCKLHATIMNTLFREDKTPHHERPRGQHNKNRVTFDAREILRKFSNFYFGEATFSSLDISLKGSYDKDGRYKNLAKIQLNNSFEM